MEKAKIKVYTYTRVSTAMQVDGYSLDAQKARMKAFADFNNYEIAGEYEDAGKSGRSIEGRVQFNQMIEDIKSDKDGVSYVLVFKLSRFGRNAADVLSSLQTMQDFGVNLICVEDGIDSSKDAGKLIISVLSAVAEIEKDNIRVQTLEGRMQKAREGRWVGGFAPYGYRLINGALEINEDEAEAIRIIFDRYLHTDMGSNGIARYLANQGIHKIERQNGKNPYFDAALIRRIIQNPVYCGKIAYGRRRTEKVHGTRNDYHLVEKDDYILVDGRHEGIISEDDWQAAQVKVEAQAKKYEHVNRGKDERIHLLTGIVKCPLCGAGMYGNKSVKHRDGKKYKDYYFYGCKHRLSTRGHKCDYKKQISEEVLDSAVAEVITALVKKPKFAALMQSKIDMKVDTAAIDQEIENYEKELRHFYSLKSKLVEEIDGLDFDDRHYSRRKSDLEDRLSKAYDRIDELEELLLDAKAKKRTIEAEKITGDNIYKILFYFDKMYAVMDEAERRHLMESLIDEVQIYEERQPNGQWLKSIRFKLPIIDEDMSLSLDNDSHIELVHLRNYLNDGGAILFVVYVTPNEDQTEILKKVYYTELTPVKLSSLISECPIIQNTKTIHLKAVPKNADDFASIVLNCYLNCKRQTSFAGAKLQTVEELQEKGVLESIQFFVSGFGDDYKGPRGFLKSDTPLYAKIKGSAIPQPLKYEGEALDKTIAYDVDHNVSCNNVVFRNKYRVTATTNKSVIHLGYGITLTFDRDKEGCQFNYKASHKLREFVSDAPFMLAFAKAKCFMIGDVSLDFSGCEFDTGNYNLVEHEADYQRLARYVKMLDKQGCTDDIDYTVLKPEDWRNLERLTQATLDGKPVYGLSNDLSPIAAMNVGKLKFAVGLNHCDEEGAYTLCHVQDCKDIIWCSPDQSEIIPVPIAAIFKPEDYTTLSNIHFDEILPSIQSFPVNAHTCAVANQIMLNMVLASDKAESTRKKILLKTALSIAEWLVSIPDDVWGKDVATLNKLQIIIRQRPLAEEERAILHVMTMMPNAREDIVFAALALLDNMK